MPDPNLTAQFVFTLAQASPRTVTLSWETRDGTAVENIDYVPASGQLVFLPGQTSKTVTIQVLQPPTEERKFFTVAITDAVNATVDDTEPGQVVIMPSNVFRGKRGFKGDRGQRGMSAYEEAINNGSFSGTYTQWLEFLRQALADLANRDDPSKNSALVAYKATTVRGALDNLNDTRDSLRFKYKLALSLPGKHPESDWVQSTYGSRFYTQSFVIDEYSNKLLVIDGGTPKIICVYDWPSGKFDRVFVADSGLVSEGAVIVMEGDAKYLYLRTAGDKLAKYNITSYPQPRAVLAPETVTSAPCGLNFTYRNGVWTISDINASANGNRSRGKFYKANSELQTIGWFDAGNLLMGIYAGQPGDTSVTKTQGIADTGYGIISGMGGQSTSNSADSPYGYIGLRSFNYDGGLEMEALCIPSAFRKILSEKMGLTVSLCESEGVQCLRNGEIYHLVMTCDWNSPAWENQGITILQAFAPDGVDFRSAAAPRAPKLGRLGMPLPTSAGLALVNPVTSQPMLTIIDVMQAMANSGQDEWKISTSKVNIKDVSGVLYKTGSILKLEMIDANEFYLEVKGFNYKVEKRLRYNTGTSTWGEEQISNVLFGQPYNADGLVPGSISLKRASDTTIQVRMVGSDGVTRATILTLT